jgi:hypothetical protein
MSPVFPGKTRAERAENVHKFVDSLGARLSAVKNVESGENSSTVRKYGPGSGFSFAVPTQVVRKGEKKEKKAELFTPKKDRSPSQDRRRLRDDSGGP